MSDYDFGPEWFWRTIFILACISLLGILVGLVMGIIWLIHHIAFV